MGYVVNAVSASGCKMWISLPKDKTHRAFGPRRDAEVFRTQKEAQAVIANTPAQRTEYPALDDPEAWRAMIAAHDGAIAAMMAGRESP